MPDETWRGCGGRGRGGVLELLSTKWKPLTLVYSEEIFDIFGLMSHSLQAIFSWYKQDNCCFGLRSARSAASYWSVAVSGWTRHKRFIRIYFVSLEESAVKFQANLIHEWNHVNTSPFWMLVATDVNTDFQQKGTKVSYQYFKFTNVTATNQTRLAFDLSV